MRLYYCLAVSLGEAIARKAATADIMTQDDSCQTSPVLLQSLKRSLNNRVERATNPHSVWRKPQPSKPGQLFLFCPLLSLIVFSPRFTYS